MNVKINKDWPYLQKYTKENEGVSSPKRDENRVVFIGDSITEFWSLLSPDFFVGKPYFNRGISGQTSPQILIRFRADAIALRPKLVVLLAGANDIAGNTGPSTLEMIANNLFSMAELAKANQIKIILCSVLPAFDFPWKTGSFPAEKIMQLNARIQEYAKEKDILYLDYYSEMVDSQKGMKTNYTDDGVHPNAAGYKIMELLVEKAIAFCLSN